MTQTIRRQRKDRYSKRAEYGAQIERIERRREVWKLRARGLSLRAIAKELGISLDMAWRDVRAEQDFYAESPEVVRQQLLETHRDLIGGLLAAFEREVQHGQSVENYNANGELVSRQVKSTPNVQLAGEAGRAVMRIAQLLGLIQQGPDAEGAAATGSQTTINLISPGDPAAFQQHAAALAAARAQEPAIDVQVAEPAPAEPPADAQHPQELEPPQEPAEGPLSDPELAEVDVEAALARIAAARGKPVPRPRRRGSALEARAQRGMRGPRFLPAPQRN